MFAGCGKPAPAAEPDNPPGKSQAVKEPSEAPPTDLYKALAHFNRGAALMEQYKYSEAAKAFETVLKLRPDWLAARFNLGLACFNMHGIAGAKGHLETARKAFEAVLARQPDHLHARFCLGLYHQHLGEDAAARDCFRKVYQADRNDPYVAYKYAETLLSLGQDEEGTKMLQHVVALDPGFVSGIYRLALQYNRRRQPERARPLFQRFRELYSAELSGGSFGVRKMYGAAGKYYLALGADNLPVRPSDRAKARPIVFSPEIKHLDTRVGSHTWGGAKVDLPGIAVGDANGDGRLDVCLTCVGEDGGTALFFGDGAGGFSPGVELATKGISPCFGDVDNDGDLDLWLGRAGGETLLENDGKGNFRRAESPKPAAGDWLTTSARLLDIDSDGDLDLLAMRLGTGAVPVADAAKPRPSAVWNNNRDGTMTDIAAKLGLALSDTPVAAVVYDDFDNDRDVDLVVFPAGAGHPIAWVNDRVWKYRTRDAAAAGLAVRHVVGATSGDPDRDGDRDLLIFSREGVRLFINRGAFRFQEHQGFTDRFGSLGGTTGQFADMDNDGDLDLVIADAHRRDGGRGPAMLVNDWPRDRFLLAGRSEPGNLLGALRWDGNAGCAVADFTGDGKCDVLLTPLGRKPMLVQNVTPGGHWIELDLLGTRQKDRMSRSNNSAIGARVEVKAGAVFQQFTVGVPAGPVAMPPLRIHAGLGRHPKVDWLRILWPDAVLQAELEMPGDRVTAVTELPRKTSSCPHLFAWDGTRFRFVSDFGGVGGLGYWIGPGTCARPDPTEVLPVPDLKPSDGEYILQVVEPLEEVVYFDQAKLVAVDHPVGTEVYPHEMMAVGLSPPPFEVFCFGKPIEPVRAVDHRGRDVTEAVLRLDRRYAGADKPDSRFPGLAEDHFVELDFGPRLRRVEPGSRLVLCLQGWVHYGYSSANFAAHQAGVRAKAPTIEVFRGGRWGEVFREAGYPAGVQHTMTLDVTGKILPSDGRIRVKSNMEIYWDRIFLSVHRKDAARVSEPVSVKSADLHFLGYPREYSPDGRRPNLYDYANVDRTAAWKLMTGSYTRFGEVAELLERADDCYVIMGRGEELTLRFPADTFGPVPRGCRRTLLLKTDSFCKDMDLCTAHSDTVEPLPFHAMSGYPFAPGQRYPDTDKTREYRRTYNTRRVRVLSENSIRQSYQPSCGKK